MRLATLGVAVVLLVGMTPALAHSASEADANDDEWHNPENSEDRRGTHEVTAGVPFGDEIVINETAYVKGGWWADEAIGQGLDQSGSTNEKVTWLAIREDGDTPQFPYDVTVTVDGPAVAAMDVFRVYEDGEAMTPNCPQTLVEDVYPRDGEGLGWAFRVLQETTQYHQRAQGASATGEMNVQLAPSEGPYIVAVYPQLATGAAGEATVNTTVHASGDDRFLVQDSVKDNQQPSEPFHIDEWTGDLDTILECVGEGVGLPDAVELARATEMPGPGTLEHQVTQLLETSLP